MNKTMKLQFGYRLDTIRKLCPETVAVHLTDWTTAVRQRGPIWVTNENNLANNWFMFSLIENFTLQSLRHHSNVLLYSNILRASQQEGPAVLLMPTYQTGSVQAHPHSLQRLITIQEELHETWTQKLRSRSCLWTRILSSRTCSYIFKSLKSTSRLGYQKH